VFAFINQYKDFFIYFIYGAVFLVVLNRAYGVSNLLRFIFRYLNIGYSDPRMKKLDDRWFDIQLFKVINGINATDINDARLIQRGLNEGALNPSFFILSSSWGDVTKKMSLKKKVFSYLVGVAFFVMGSSAWYEQNALISGFVKIDYTNYSFFLSKEKLMITSRGGSIEHATVRSKDDCIRTLDLVDETSIAAIACNKFLDSTLSYHWWLEKEIKSIDGRKNTLMLFSYLYCIISVLWIFSLFQFNRANAMVASYKLSQSESS